MAVSARPAEPLHLFTLPGRQDLKALVRLGILDVDASQRGHILLALTWVPARKPQSRHVGFAGGVT
jgi:hypothetical protein